jgi:hypothetical protein
VVGDSAPEEGNYYALVMSSQGYRMVDRRREMTVELPVSERVHPNYLLGMRGGNLTTRESGLGSRLAESTSRERKMGTKEGERETSLPAEVAIERGLGSRRPPMREGTEQLVPKKVPLGSRPPMREVAIERGLGSRPPMRNTRKIDR